LSPLDETIIIPRPGTWAWVDGSRPSGALPRAISDFLDDQRQIVEQVRRNLARGLRMPRSGRCGLTPQQVLPSLVLKRVRNWNYRELPERTADGETLRQFTEFHWQRVPKHHAFHCDFNQRGE
jgi:transposase, IS5 family